MSGTVVPKVGDTVRVVSPISMQDVDGNTTTLMPGELCKVVDREVYMRVMVFDLVARNGTTRASVDDRHLVDGAFPIEMA